MTEGPTPREPRDEPPREPLGGPEAPVDQPPPEYPPADTTPGPQDAPRWESPGTPPPQGGTGSWDPGPGATPGFRYREHLEACISHGTPPIRWIRRILADALPVAAAPGS